ncbi:MAG: hypothetical protein IT289_04675 [Oligoflexia bacterium]|nr:hypothetical protein [Oligoflexia bacterium]
MKIFGLLTFILLNISTAHAREVEFSWAPMEGATKYEIQIDDNGGFQKPRVSMQTEKPLISTNLEVGKYFYRVRVIPNQGRPGKWSKPAEVLVSPYAPELEEPQESFETSYFEILPKINFKWKTPGKELEYEILITRATGQKILEERTKEPTFVTEKLEEGDYHWMVRAVSNKTLASTYTPHRFFRIVKKPLAKPKLILPPQDGMSAAYRPIDFKWEKDPNTHFTDLYLEKLTGRQGEKPYKKKIDNLTKSEFQAPYAEPGKYRWSVITKEGKDTPGVKSEIADFEVRDDVMSAGNYELEFSTSYVDDLYTTTSSRQTAGASRISQQSSAISQFYGFSAGYYLFQSLGFYFSTRTGRTSVENYGDLSQETDLTLRLRFGSKGFNQEFWFGYRIMDIIAVEKDPALLTTNFSTNGGLVGTRMNATVADGWKAFLTAYYFKPTADIYGHSGLVADVYGGSLGVKWNFAYQFWVGYRFGMSRVTGIYTTPGQPTNVNSQWTQYRLEPAYFSISFEH